MLSTVVFQSCLHQIETILYLKEMTCVEVRNNILHFSQRNFFQGCFYFGMLNLNTNTVQNMGPTTFSMLVYCIHHAQHQLWTHYSKWIHFQKIYKDTNSRIHYWCYLCWSFSVFECFKVMFKKTETFVTRKWKSLTQLVAYYNR